jgi:hypothetical protein
MEDCLFCHDSHSTSHLSGGPYTLLMSSIMT